VPVAPVGSERFEIITPNFADTHRQFSNERPEDIHNYVAMDVDNIAVCQSTENRSGALCYFCYK